jgi:predicted site-specific integrase-resolvase
MPRELLTLKEWARRIYGAAAPSMGTLRRWAREGSITPPAEKHGRTYFVEPDARYVDYQVLKAEARRRAREAGRPAPRGRLLERLTHGGKA